MTLIVLLVVLLVIAVVVWATRALLAAFGVPQPIATVVYVLVVVICAFWFLDNLGVMSLGGPVIRLR